jgi:hypothetical protein
MSHDKLNRVQRAALKWWAIERGEEPGRRLNKLPDEWQNMKGIVAPQEKANVAAVKHHKVEGVELEDTETQEANYGIVYTRGICTL